VEFVARQTDVVVVLHAHPDLCDAATDRLPAPLPSAFHVVEGPANVLCHSHDEKMWHLNAIQIKGRLESREGGWVFQSTNFDAPSKLVFFQFLANTRTAGQKYLDKRGLQRPAINWTAIKEIQRRGSARR
jgi:hypothetical protein